MNLFSHSFAPRKNDIQEFSASGTWTKPARASDNDLVIVELWGGGGGGASDSTAGDGGGGGGGGYVKEIFRCADLAASCVVVIAAGGAGGPYPLDNPGSSGGGTVFEPQVGEPTLIAYGGDGGGKNGDLAGFGASDYGREADETAQNGRYGGRGGIASYSYTGHASVFGGGGGAAGRAAADRFGGSSRFAGNGGDSAGDGIAPFAVDSAKGAKTPSGGGAGGMNAAGGDGADGFARITTINGG